MVADPLVAAALVNLLDFVAGQPSLLCCFLLALSLTKLLAPATFCAFFAATRPSYVQLKRSFMQQDLSSCSVLLSPFSSIPILISSSLSLAVVAFASLHVPLNSNTLITI